MPPDDWLCQRLERLNLTVAEGYPSRSQDSAGLKRDQFIKVPKSQSKWYKMHLLKPEGPHKLGRSVFNWRNTESKVNSQFPRITRASAYPSTGPPSRPISQNSLRRWEWLPEKTFILQITQQALLDVQQSCKIKCPRTLRFCALVLTRGRHPRKLRML